MPARIRTLYRDYIGRLEMNDQISLSTERQLEFPQRLRSTYILWRSGEDLRDTLPKATYYRHRKGLLECGIDIALRRETASKSNVVALVRILEAEPAELPAWALSERLIHRSAAH